MNAYLVHFLKAIESLIYRVLDQKCEYNIVNDFKDLSGLKLKLEKK